MAGSVKGKAVLYPLLAACVAGFVMPSVMAQQLQDPTRPASAVGQDFDGDNAGSPVLQSILIGPKRRVAIISGEAVALGGHYNGAKIVSISETQVVLRNGSELQTLKLFPDVDKHRSFADGTSRTTVEKTHRKQ